jgi:hypothetical protein
MAATKLDLITRSPELYSAGREPALLEVPELSFLMVDGHGDPNVSPAYAEAVEALYSVAYTVKFALKKSPRQLDHRVMPLEGLWWVPDMSQFSTTSKADWDWTLMIRQLDEVDQELVTAAVQQVTGKKALPAAARLRLERFREGLAAQVLHIGPYAAEGPTIQRLHAFISEHGYGLTGKHHEIYLGDPRRAAPEKLRTILRQPVIASG